MVRTSDPVINGLVIFCRIFDVFVYLRSIVRFRGPVPCAHVNTNGKAVGQELLGSLDVDVSGRSRGSWVEMWVMGCQFTAES